MPARVIFNRNNLGARSNIQPLIRSAMPQNISRRIRNFVKPPTSEPIGDHQKLKDLVDNSEKVLLKIKGVFPFDLFPDIIVIDVNKVNIIKRNFFFDRRLHSISIKSITEIYVQMSPLFASLHIVDMAMNPGNKISVRYLHKKQAARARRLIQGLVDATKQEIDLSQMSASDIVEMLNEAGRIRTKGE